MPDQPAAQKDGCGTPYQDENSGSGDADRTGGNVGRLQAKFGHQGWFNQLDHQKDAERNDDDIVEIADDRDKIRDQVDWRKRIGRKREGQQLGIPWRARIAGGKPEGKGVAFDALGPDF